MSAKLLIYGAPGMIRTCDLLVRSQTLYPTELRARLGGNYNASLPQAVLVNPAAGLKSQGESSPDYGSSEQAC